MPSRDASTSNTNTMAKGDIWCIAVDQEKKLYGTYFPVEVSTETNVAALKEEIQRKMLPGIPLPG